MSIQKKKCKRYRRIKGDEPFQYCDKSSSLKEMVVGIYVYVFYYVFLWGNRTFL